MSGPGDAFPLGGPGTPRLPGRPVPLSPRFLERLSGACAQVDTDPSSLAEAGRDWWPIGLRWAAAGQVPALAGALARPAGPEEVAGVLALCHREGVPVIPVGARSGVCGGAVPVFGGVCLDLGALSGLGQVDDASLLVEAGAGTLGQDLEDALRRDHRLTLGHWPQSMAISSVGGWLACRSAGQYSTRYGKIEDMVVGLEVALADGRLVRTGGQGPRQAVGPDLNQVFVGSEGTLGVITRAWLRARPVPSATGRRAFGFASFEQGLEACRLVLRSGATPAVLRLYDRAESARHFGDADACVLVVLDEAEPPLLEATLSLVERACRPAAPRDPSLVDAWLARRNDVSALGEALSRGLVVDTVEVAARWSALPALYRSVLDALRALEGTVAASAHQSHAYPDGACLYFTFAGLGPDPADLDWADAYYRSAWQAVMAATLAAGAAISHHHGVGLNRGPWVEASLGPSAQVLRALKAALDPKGILNPAKLGLGSPFGPPPWP
ncbi:MAG TPA: FAD-binding oxidoreductase [Acidimicrobiales bacterium]|nr:FAD-binding oxidoreductase [Acidimicrobiales bacterium]